MTEGTVQDHNLAGGTALLILEECCQIPSLSQTLPALMSCSGGICPSWCVTRALITPCTFCDSDSGGHLWFVMPVPSLLPVLCDHRKSSHQPSAGLLSLLPIPQRTWSHIAMDFVTGLFPSYGHTVILTILDQFSKFAHLVPICALISGA